MENKQETDHPNTIKNTLDPSPSNLNLLLPPQLNPLHISLQQQSMTMAINIIMDTGSIIQNTMRLSHES
jgi:hypothetical protein